MSTEENKALVRRFYDEFNKQNWAGVEEDCASRTRQEGPGHAGVCPRPDLHRRTGGRGAEVLAAHDGPAQLIAPLAIGFPHTQVYSVGKDGLSGCRRVLRADYRAHGVSSSAPILASIGGAGTIPRTMEETGVAM